MQLSKRTQYAIRAMICLCDTYPRGFIQTRELASRERIPTKFLESILAALCRGKFLVSKIGASGGYRLARRPEEIYLSDLIGRLEGKKLSSDGSAPSEDMRSGEVAVDLLQHDLTAAFEGVLRQTTLAMLNDRVHQYSRGGQMFYI
ncbi:MAG: RrF2 family transcriptional regulator [Phycisphaerae bacterium]